MAIDPCSHTTNPDPLRVLVIDAHPAVGLGLVRLVGIMPGLKIWGLAACGADGVAQAAATSPDVILVDAELPHGATPATIRQLRARLPLARVVALGLYPDRRAAMLAAGAHAFILKDAGFEALRAAMVARPVPDRDIERESASVRTPGSVLR